MPPVSGEWLLSIKLSCIRAGLHVAVAWLMVALAGCVGVANPEGPAGEPYVRGSVESITARATATGLLVRAGPGSREMCGINADVDTQTRYFRRTGAGKLQQAALADVSIGDTVEVYVEGPVAESCPVQGSASAIVVVSEAGL